MRLWPTRCSIAPNMRSPAAPITQSGSPAPTAASCMSDACKYTRGAPALEALTERALAAAPAAPAEGTSASLSHPTPAWASRLPAGATSGATAPGDSGGLGFLRGILVNRLAPRPELEEIRRVCRIPTELERDRPDRRISAQP